MVNKEIILRSNEQVGFIVAGLNDDLLESYHCRIGRFKKPIPNDTFLIDGSGNLWKMLMKETNKWV